MEYIAKLNSPLATEAHELLNRFLNRCDKGGFAAHDDLYALLKSDKEMDGPSSNTTYRSLRRLLLSENESRCCYCMRRLDEEKTTLEHVIPNKTPSQEDYNNYQPFYEEGLWQKMVFAKAFLMHPMWPGTAYPHTVAYENLLPSCDGKFAKVTTSECHARDNRVSKCCNNFRGEKFVIPFVLNAQMVSEFRYKSNGMVVWPVRSDVVGDLRMELLLQHKETIDKLGLNCAELVAIRRIWFFLSALQRDCVPTEKERTILYLLEDKNLTNPEKAMLENFWSDNYWDLLSDFRYFKDHTKFADNPS